MSDEALHYKDFSEHVHAHTGLTSCNLGHCHMHPGVTSTPLRDERDSERGMMSHYHLIAGQTSYDHGHFHAYRVATGPAIPLPQGYHTHFVSFATSFNNGHDHQVQGFVEPTMHETTHHSYKE